MLISPFRFWPVPKMGQKLLQMQTLVEGWHYFCRQPWKWTSFYSTSFDALSQQEKQLNLFNTDHGRGKIPLTSVVHEQALIG